jgi:hypothetical protein
MLAGACLCGTVRFEAEPALRWFAHCHCSMCRRHHGTLYGTTVGIARQRLHWRAGEDRVEHYRATAAFERPFCGVCGAKVPGASNLEGVLTVPAGLLTGELAARPRAHIFAASKSPLTVIADGLPQHAAYPPGVPLRAVADAPAGGVQALLTGRCLCGAVAYEADVLPRRIVHCHCSLCRRSRGTGCSSTLVVPAEAFRWTRGERGIRAYRMPAPRTYGADFCAACGSIVPTVAGGRALLPAGSVDAPPAPLPGVHIYVGSKASWEEITDGAPQFAELPPQERYAEFFG